MGLTCRYTSSTRFGLLVITRDEHQHGISRDSISAFDLAEAVGESGWWAAVPAGLGSGDRVRRSLVGSARTGRRPRSARLPHTGRRFVIRRDVLNPTESHLADAGLPGDLDQQSLGQGHRYPAAHHLADGLRPGGQ